MVLIVIVRDLGGSRAKAEASWLVPEARMVRGVIAACDMTPIRPTIGLSTDTGRLVVMALDPSNTVVMYGGRIASFDQLAQGRQVKAYYTVRNGHEVARSIVVFPTTVSFPPPQTDTPVATSDASTRS